MLFDKDYIIKRKLNKIRELKENLNKNKSELM